MTKVKKKKTFSCRYPGKSVAEKINEFSQWSNSFEKGGGYTCWLCFKSIDVVVCL